MLLHIINNASYHQCCIASPMLHQIINHAYHIIAASYHQQCILSTLYHIIIINAPVHYHHCIKSSTLHYNNSAALTFLMLPGHILDLYCVRLSNTAPFCKNYAKLYFDAKHLEKGLNRDGIFEALFFEKCPFS